MVYTLLQSPKFYIMGRHFEKMRKGAFPVTRRYRSDEELRQDPPEADVYITGSDQVWGPIGTDAYDPAFFLNFSEEKSRRISYAASFGKTEFTPELKSRFAEMLGRYEAITVRENSAVALIREMGISHVQQVLDPTLLIPAEVWAQKITDTFPRSYILVYQLHNNQRMLEYAYAMSEKTGLPLVTMSSTAQHLSHKGSKHVFLPSLSQWLGYIKNASFMITDSFHGTAFAINFGTQFINVLPEETSTRNRSILELTGLQNRVVTDFSDLSFLERPIDFAPVHRIIRENRQRSYDILDQLLNKKESL